MTWLSGYLRLVNPNHRSEVRTTRLCLVKSQPQVGGTYHQALPGQIPTTGQGNVPPGSAWSNPNHRSGERTTRLCLVCSDHRSGIRTTRLCLVCPNHRTGVQYHQALPGMSQPQDGGTVPPGSAWYVPTAGRGYSTTRLCLVCPDRRSGIRTTRLCLVFPNHRSGVRTTRLCLVQSRPKVGGTYHNTLHTKS